MKVYKINYKVYLMRNIGLIDMLSEIGAVIDKALITSKEYQNFHNNNAYKYYCFSGFKPIEKGNVYKKNNIYTITIRTIDYQLAQYLKNTLPIVYTEGIKGLVAEISDIPYNRPFEKIYSLTPLIVSANGYWKDNLQLAQYEKALKENLIKKYNSITNSKIDENFELYTQIEFLNSNPIPTHYKNITFLGDSIEIMIAGNTAAQNLAYMALGTGLLEKNARGYGYVDYRLY